MKHPYHSKKASQSGSALLISLVMMALLTAIVLAFLSRSESNYKIESSSAARMRAEIMARSSLQYTVALLTKEITRPENSEVIHVPEVNGTVYRPKTAANILPTVHIKSTLNAARSSHMPAIIKQSIVAMDSNASVINSGTANKQGRLVEPSRWNDPIYYFSNTQFNTTAQSPDWIYFSTDGATNVARPNIIGRAAFNIYNIDNLIDVSVAGYPSTLSGDIQKINALKSSMAGADMTRLGSPLVPIINDPKNFIVDSRNRRSARDGTYVERVLANTNGMTLPSVGDTQFISRLDLLRFFDSNGINANALSYVTAWSRAKDAPSVYITPVTEENPFAPATLRTTKAAVTDYILQSSGTIKTRQRDLPVGDSVASRRFPLNRIALFGASPGSLRSAAISRYFGLEISANGHWRYTDTHIKTLSEIKSLSREPNFFEMLKAAILTGSLGTYNADDTETFNPARDQNKDLQILRMGASIIDATAFTDKPTIISLTESSGITSFATGVKDLPYLHGVRFRQMIKTDASGNIEQIDHYALPVLVNPHAAPAREGKARPMTRIRIAGNVQSATASLSSGTAALTPRLLSSTSMDERTLGFSADRYRVLSPINEAQVPTLEDGTEIKTAPMPTHFEGSYRAFWLARANVSGSVTEATKGEMVLQKFNLILEYWNGSQWVTYDALTGDGWNTETHHMGDTITVSLSTTKEIRMTLSDEDFTGAETEYFLKPDPRTNRWGVAQGMTSSSPLEVPDEAVTSYAFTTPSPSDLFPALRDADAVERDNDLVHSGEAVSDVLENEASLSRQPLLNRSYYVVGELGVVFRDQPWKTLDFNTEESGDKALLDYFTINESDESGNVAGRINLNVRSPQDAISPLMAHLGMDVDGVIPFLSKDIQSMYTRLTQKIRQSPFQSPVQLVEISDAINVSDMNKQKKESIVRGLGTSTQTRTWNFFIDLIAQTGGMYPQTSTDLGKDFIVHGESRLWMHVAIDRFTGKVIASHTEVYQE